MCEPFSYAAVSDSIDTSNRPAIKGARHEEKLDMAQWPITVHLVHELHLTACMTSSVSSSSQRDLYAVFFSKEKSRDVTISFSNKMLWT